MKYFPAFLALMFSSVYAEDAPKAPVEITDKDKANLSGSLNDFGSDLYTVLHAKHGNLVYSTGSMAEALAMTYAGARGQTANEMEAALHLRMNNDYAFAAMAEIRKDMQARSAAGGYSFSIANALWVDKDAELQQSYTDTVTGQFGAGLELLDFKMVAAATTINQWVSEKTGGKIHDLIAQGGLDPETKLVLTNAVYFKADWKEPFAKNATRQADFHLNPAQDSPVMLMHRDCKECRYTQQENFQVLAIPYKNDDIEMVIFLPRDRNGMNDFEETFTAQTLRQGVEALEPHDVDIFLPRFHIESDINMKATLGALGISQAFDAKHADFSGMTGKQDLYISDVIHKAMIDVDEAGSEAAAATAVVMMPTAMPLGGAKAEFRADHPFIFALRDTHTGEMYFMGRMENPGY